MRCCVATLDALPDDYETTEGEVLDCTYEEAGNERLRFVLGAWEWNNGPIGSYTMEETPCP
jgi:hypothetical protein